MADGSPVGPRARIAMEFFREPDPEIEQLAYGFTMGMALSAPMVLIGAALVIRSALLSRRPVDAARLLRN
jgi:prolipoprotein diacylglyceryltransferase